MAPGDPLEAIRAVDAERELDAVLAIPDHLRDALWRIESAKLEPADAPTTVVCGMGGSAIGGDLAGAAFGNRLQRPLLTARGYELPPGAMPESLVLCSSYSGDTEETLACYEGAEALGARRIVATTGGRLAERARADGVPVIGLPAGLQPRAAVGYMFCVAAEAAKLSGAADSLHTEIDSCAAHLEAQRDGLATRSAELAAALRGATAVIYGSGLTAPVAYRWKTQLNENGKVPAFAAQMPEADHNEIAGWEGAEECGKFVAVLLEDSDQHPRERERFELTAELIEPHVDRVVRLETEGETRTERMLQAVMLGDLVSLQVAAARGVDPSPVPVIEKLKDGLGRP
ncbi:MAG: bifunctional phosphoglucose/phosphomannose isomerase [Solirubrobacterales bacterium]